MEGKNLTVGSLDKFDIFRLRNFPFFQFFTGNGNFSRVGKLSFAKISNFFPSLACLNCALIRRIRFYMLWKQMSEIEHF